jgi:hypothetical protein
MNLENIEQYLIYTLSDNGEWEYTREGIGVYLDRTFIVDLDDTGEEERELQFCKEGVDVLAVLIAGKKTGRYEQCPSGTFYYNMNTDGDSDSEATFLSTLGIE